MAIRGKWLLSFVPVDVQYLMRILLGILLRSFIQCECATDRSWGLSSCGAVHRQWTVTSAQLSYHHPLDLPSHHPRERPSGPRSRELLLYRPQRLAKRAPLSAVVGDSWYARRQTCEGENFGEAYTALPQVRCLKL